MASKKNFFGRNAHSKFYWLQPTTITFWKISVVLPSPGPITSACNLGNHVSTISFSGFFSESLHKRNLCSFFQHAQHCCHLKGCSHTVGGNFVHVWVDNSEHCLMCIEIYLQNRMNYQLGAVALYHRTSFMLAENVRQIGALKATTFPVCFCLFYFIYLFLFVEMRFSSFSFSPFLLSCFHC